MILTIINVIVGLLFLLFLPGYLLTLILFDKNDLHFLERVILAVGLSISIDVFLGLILGLNRSIAFITGGLTRSNVWSGLIVISLLFLMLLVHKKK